MESGEKYSRRHSESPVRWAKAANITAAYKDAFRGHSALYASEDNYYYLVTVFKEVEEVGAMQNVLAVLSEYGEVQPMSVARELCSAEEGQLQ